ncbi:ATP phosphoribosyltransferase regulatory subunit [Tepidiphilus baoligensis]|uniref:ATP phosphoribosyltransferase regulatory subunit n=1 Tax=Tepidiphilus baoligensis TaxID=2698687 RepID=A0ABX1QN33_9PROT|nr:ATP phosphoribosyltransferase regulatory subunit [Tepidiphilus baoligensis]NMH17297.1 ATP phosphoribosyltransferase regulatory subunit [Tepidiphilus baoligensis]
MRWVLPDYLRDELPPAAEHLERLRRDLLDLFRLHGYQLVAPPLIEFLSSLIVGGEEDLRLRTFGLTDQLSGQTMGVRADITPQVARIDAHLLNRRGVTRLCYCGPVLHTLPASLTATREPLQLGAELYGHGGVEADIEIIRLLATALERARLPAVRIDVGHMGLFRALTEGMDHERAEALFELLQAKDSAGIENFLATTGAEIDEARAVSLCALPGLYGGIEVLSLARSRLAPLPAVVRALEELEALAEALADLPLGFDLADLRGYHYHTGVMFAAYGANHPSALALGGRYDGLGAAFGRARPATGFSIDLRELIARLPLAPLPGAILAPAVDDEALEAVVAQLREAGQAVVRELPGHPLEEWREAGCDRCLVRRAGQWVVEPL